MIKKHLEPELPSFLYSYDTKAPFTHCIHCHESLEGKERYAIEKVFKQNRSLNKSEIVYEYAICLDCAEGMHDEISEKSMVAIRQLFEEHAMNMQMRLEYLHETEQYQMEPWTERCFFTNKEIRMCDEYTVSAIIEDGALAYEHTPLVYSDTFMEILQSRLSKETTDYFDDFRDTHFDIDPELKDLIGGPTVGIL